MQTAHSLRPLVLALSTKLNWPEDLLMEVSDMHVATHGEHSLLAAMSRHAAMSLAKSAVAFNAADDVMAFAETDWFRSEIGTAGVALMRVATMPWPKEITDAGGEDERRFRRACLDMGAACFALGSGRVPRPDKGNLLTSLAKAIPRYLEGVTWTFSGLPDYGREIAAS